MPDHHAPGLSAATALLFVWSVLTLIVRVGVKLGKSESWGWDDTSIVTALAFSLAHVICVFHAVNDGFGLSDDALSGSAIVTIEKALYASQIFYVVSVGLTKVSTGLFIAQLTRHGPRVNRAYTLVASCGVWTLAGVLILALRGDLHQPWATIDGSSNMFTRWLIVESLGLAIEVALWGLTVNIIWQLSMPLIKRFLILLIFGCRLLLIPLVSFRLYWLSPTKNPDRQISTVTGYILTEAVLQFAFISASITCLKPFLKPFNASYVVSNVTNSNSGWRSSRHKGSKDPYYVLSAVQRSDKNGLTVSSATQDSGSSSTVAAKTRAFRKSFRPEDFERQTNISASTQHDAVEIETMDSSTIRKTESWSVRVEERPGGSQTGSQKSMQPTSGNDRDDDIVRVQ